MMQRRRFLGAAGAGVAASVLLGTGGGPARGETASGGSAALFLPEDDLQPATMDRLPLRWNKERVRQLMGKLEEEGQDGILLTDRWNIIHFTGLWHRTTERLSYAFFPVRDPRPIWFYPGLDRDLVRGWWYHDGEMYFDWPHGQGGFPNRGVVQMGAKVDLFEWVMKGLKKRGFAGKKLAADRELVPSFQGIVKRVLGREMSSAARHCMDLRVRKTPEEQALWRRAYNVFNQVHAFARDLLLEHGTDLTDYDIASAATKYGTDLLMSGIQRDGRPHTATGIRLSVGCRVGPGTAYPHPNQFHHNRVQKGQALQIAGGIRIGGCGGELYRAFLIHPWTDHMKKVWTISRDCAQIQKEESVAGVTCSTVAYKIHKYQVDNGMARFIYHRPAHGEGSEGHQPPYLALGDHTMLEPGMVFSVEPGLYDPENGFGVNWSDSYFVQPHGPARQMSRLPWSEEWCLVTL
ncbi:MAG: M24 family metallopeptidase [Acidobacteriota bacterium]